MRLSRLHHGTPALDEPDIEPDEDAPELDEPDVEPDECAPVLEELDTEPDGCAIEAGAAEVLSQGASPFAQSGMQGMPELVGG